MSDSDGMAGALEFAGVSLGEGDLEVLRVVAQVFEPAIRALDAADLSELPLESDLDPSRSPSNAETTQAG
jgi:hypothetical protein